MELAGEGKRERRLAAGGGSNNHEQWGLRTHEKKFTGRLNATTMAQKNRTAAADK